MLEGEPCPVRQLADVAVVQVSSSCFSELTACDERLCYKVPGDSRTVFVLGAESSGPLGGVHLAAPVTAGSLVTVVREALHAING